MLSLSDICEEEEDEEEEEEDVAKGVCDSRWQHDPSTCRLIKADVKTPADPHHTPCDSRPLMSTRPALGEIYSNGTGPQQSYWDGYSPTLYHNQRKDAAAGGGGGRVLTNYNSNYSTSGKWNGVDVPVRTNDSNIRTEWPSVDDSSNFKNCPPSMDVSACGARDEETRTRALRNKDPSHGLHLHPECHVDLDSVTRAGPGLGPYGDATSTRESCTATACTASINMAVSSSTSPTDSCSQTSSYSSSNPKTDAITSIHQFKDEDCKYRAVIPVHEVKRGLTRKQILKLSAMSACGFLLVGLIILWVMSPALF